MIVRLLVVLCLFSSTCLHAQEDYAREVIEQLCSPDFHGRGYVQDGDKVAADYIVDQLKDFKVKAFNKEYYQPFTLDVNTFPGQMSVNINDQELVPGQDFIVQPQSGKCYGSYELLLLQGDSIEEILDQLETLLGNLEHRLGSVIVGLHITNPEEEYSLRQIATEVSAFMPVMVVNDSKFTWGVSTVAQTYPVIEVKSKFLEDGAKVKLKIEALLIHNYETQNILGYIQGADKSRRDEYVVFTAHYDHLGHMGEDTYIPGANDNASGVSMLLSLAGYYHENPLPFSVAFLFFGAEEAGILGSKYYVENPVFELDQIDFLVNLDLLGTGEEGIQVINSTVFTEQFAVLDSLNNENEYLVNIKKRGKAANSDHHWFTEQGVPCFFIYTLGGITAYHDIYDKAETLPLTEFNDMFALLTEFVATFE